MQVFDDRFQAESGWNCRSILKSITMHGKMNIKLYVVSRFCGPTRYTSDKVKHSSLNSQKVAVLGSIPQWILKL
jgi:hypothetical protein